jgi:Ala-tRNA(Pro) deacylase
MPLKALNRFLDDHGIRYVTIRHSPAFTAQQIAASAHIPGMEIAKTVMVRIDGKMAMAVLPGSLKIDLDRLRDIAGAQLVEIATEQDFANLFPDCETGAMPPFGNLYDMPVYVAESLSKDDEIAFNAGTHTELLKLAYRDFEHLVQPTLGRFAR